MAFVRMVLLDKRVYSSSIVYLARKNAPPPKSFFLLEIPSESIFLPRDASRVFPNWDRSLVLQRSLLLLRSDPCRPLGWLF